MYSNDLDNSLSIHLPNSVRTFQAEVLGIEEVCGVLLNNYERIRKATIYTDSQAALVALSVPRINDGVVNNCRKVYSSLAGQLDTSIIWVSFRS